MMNDGAPTPTSVMRSGRQERVRQEAETSRSAVKLTGKVWPFSRNWGTELDVVQLETM